MPRGGQQAEHGQRQATSRAGSETAANVPNTATGTVARWKQPLKLCIDVLACRRVRSEAS